MPRTLRARILVAAVALITVASACGVGDSAAQAKPEDAARAAAAAALFTVPAGQSLALEMADIKFSTKAISAKSGDVVEVALSNKGSIEHDFSIVTLPGEKAYRVGDKDTEVAKGKNEIHAHLKAGQSGLLRLKAAAPGTYEFFCTVPGHKEAGMKGTLSVQ